jgi:hypothetical protein
MIAGALVFGAGVFAMRHGLAHSSADEVLNARR